MKQLLLVHDSDVVMNALGLVLGQEGYEVVVSRALDQADRYRPDLVLVDAYDRALHGHGAVADLKLARGLASPIYLFGSMDEASLLGLCERAGADGYISTEWGFPRLISVLQRAVQRAAEALPEPVEGSRVLASSQRVLVLDDHPGALARLVSELQRYGYAARGCRDFAECERLLRQWEPDAIVADVVLPGIEGDMVCKRLKSRTGKRAVPVVLLSSMPERLLQERGRRAGADAVCRKQDGIDRLLQVLSCVFSEIVF